MIYVGWLALYAQHVVSKALAIVLAPVACAWPTQDKRHLPAWAEWMGTIDWDMAGDEPWRARRLIGKDPLSYINRVRWIWRNGAQRMAYCDFGVLLAGLHIETSGDNDPDTPPFGHKLYSAFRVSQVGGVGGGRHPVPGAKPVAFFRKSCWRVTESRHLEIMWGWKLNNPVQGRAKIIGSVRLRKTGEPS